MCASHAAHWLFSTKIQVLLEVKCIPFTIRASGDRSMDVYDGNPARTLPTAQYDSPLQAGEIIVRTTKRARPKQLSIHPRYLVPWKPLVGCEVVVTNGSGLGAVGVVKGRQGDDWTVTFKGASDDSDAGDFVFKEKDLASLEPLKG
jgi:hypothetical protein